MRLLEILQTVAVVDRFGVQGTALGCIVDLLRRGSGTLGLVHRDLVGIRVALEHGQLAGAQLVLVLLGVGCSDDELRLLAFEWVADEVICHRCGVFFQATGPGRDTAIGVTGFLAAQWRERGAQLGRLLRGNGCHDTTSQQRQRQSAYMHHSFCFHAVFTLPCGYQKFTPKLSATKSRSPLVLKSPPKKSV
ncbi:hypothetical protein D3C80_1401980 [compost metagenome]